jgi:ubiquitin-like-conjugating enzyme ATG3
MKKTIYDAYVKTVTPLMGTLKESKFFEKGVLTPEEFLIAGENLTHKCPTWEWAPASDGKGDDKLPADKQFLVTRKVPCPNRVKDVEVAAAAVKEIEVGDGWVETNDNMKAADADEVFDLDDDAHVVEDKAEPEEEEVMDLDDLDDLDDAAENNIFASDKYTAKDDAGSGLEVNAKMRKYDLSITYDYFHQTPRMWFVGYAADGRLLKQNELLEDVMADYANKTVTFEDHPRSN